MRDYCLDSAGQRHFVVRGTSWPPGGAVLTVPVTKTVGTWEGADSWAWALVISRSQRGGTPDLLVTAMSAVISTDPSTGCSIITLAFALTADQTKALPGAGETVFRVDLGSTDGNGAVSIWEPANGTLTVRDAVGE